MAHLVTWLRTRWSARDSKAHWHGCANGGNVFVYILNAEAAHRYPCIRTWTRVRSHSDRELAEVPALAIVTRRTRLRCRDYCLRDMIRRCRKQQRKQQQHRYTLGIHLHPQFLSLNPSLLLSFSLSLFLVLFFFTLDKRVDIAAAIRRSSARSA